MRIEQDRLGSKKTDYKWWTHLESVFECTAFELYAHTVQLAYSQRAFVETENRAARLVCSFIAGVLTAFKLLVVGMQLKCRPSV